MFPRVWSLASMLWLYPTAESRPRGTRPVPDTDTLQRSPTRERQGTRATVNRNEREPAAQRELLLNLSLVIDNKVLSNTYIYIYI